MTPEKCNTYSEALAKLEKWYQKLTKRTKIPSPFDPPADLPSKTITEEWKTSSNVDPYWKIKLKYTQGAGGSFTMELTLSGKPNSVDYRFPAPAKSPEKLFRCGTFEKARNEAIKFIESRGGRFDGSQDSLIGRLHEQKGKKIGQMSGKGKAVAWTFRLDWDPNPKKGGHFNVSVVSEKVDERAAFLFDEDKDFFDKQLKNFNR